MTIHHDGPGMILLVLFTSSTITGALAAEVENIPRSEAYYQQQVLKQLNDLPGEDPRLANQKFFHVVGFTLVTLVLVTLMILRRP